MFIRANLWLINSYRVLHHDPELIAQEAIEGVAIGEGVLVALLGRGGDKAQAREGDAAAGGGKGTEWGFGEVGFGRGLVEVAHLFVVGECVWLQGETILRFPITAEVATLKDQVTVVFDDAKRARALHLLFARIE